MTKSKIKAILNPKPHPLKIQISRSGIRLWQVRRYLGGRPSEGQLCKMLNGIILMKPHVETAIQELIFHTEEERTHG